ncbi:MAG: hypothetical protein LBL67_04400 [Coriobacteriales bacterium]|jgi:hypothetical protein|nr:hypothetical protein [Coriobacteriales bacterium]
MKAADTQTQEAQNQDEEALVQRLIALPIADFEARMTAALIWKHNHLDQPPHIPYAPKIMRYRRALCYLVFDVPLAYRIDLDGTDKADWAKNFLHYQDKMQAWYGAAELWPGGWRKRFNGGAFGAMISRVYEELQTTMQLYNRPRVQALIDVVRNNLPKFGGLEMKMAQLLD